AVAPAEGAIEAASSSMRRALSPVAGSCAAATGAGLAAAGGASARTWSRLPAQAESTRARPSAAVEASARCSGERSVLTGLPSGWGRPVAPAGRRREIQRRRKAVGGAQLLQPQRVADDLQLPAGTRRQRREHGQPGAVDARHLGQV